MAQTPDIVVRNGYLPGRDSLVDVVVRDGLISSVEPDAPYEGAVELEAEGRFVSPGLVDAHVHLDMAFSAGRDRHPRYNDGPVDRSRNIERSAAYFADRTADEIASNVVDAARLAVANGVLHVRSHSYVDGQVGASVVEAVETARAALAEAIDIQTVSFPQRGIGCDPGSFDALEAGLAAGADLVGGLDPATRNDDREGTIGTWFDVAEDHGVGLDVHIHERGPGGMETLDTLAESARTRALDGPVTASHAFSLGDLSPDDAVAASERYDQAGLGIVTCYQSTPESMPIPAFDDHGAGIGHGTDQVRTIWSPHGNADALQSMLVESLRVNLPMTNETLATLWRMITDNGARVLGIADEYGIEPGTPADLVVHDAPSPHWAILTAATPAYVVKDGTVVAEAGTVRDGVFDGL